MKDGTFTADRLLALYDRVAEAEDAIPRLRRFVLDLAVRGKLVAQDAGDEPAAELLKRIAQEKARLVKAGEIAAFKSINLPCRGDLAFAIPSHWQPVFVANILNELQTGPFGSSLHQSDYRIGGTPVVNPASIQNERIVPIDKMAVGEETLARLASFKLKSGDIILARRGEMGRCAVVSESEAGWLCGTGSLILRPSSLLDARFLVLVIGSPFGRDYLGSSSVGATMQNLNQTILLSLPLGLPPLADQRRIVAKVDELMALCDRLEGARAGREVVRDRLTAATLTRLTAPETDAETFPTHARFALQTLPTLTTRPAQIKTLRQTILNLAVRGKLGGGVPGSLERLGTFRNLQNGYAFKSEWFSKQGVRLLRNANVGHGGLDWTEVVHLPIGQAGEYQRFALKEGDIVLTLDRPFIVTGTKVARVTASDLPALLLQRVGRFVETAVGLSDDYLFLWINSPHFNEQIDPGRSNGVPHISSKQVEAAELFLPPLAEQHRIVAKVDALMALCDQLEASLTTTTTTRSRLLEALLHEALGGQSEAA